MRYYEIASGYRIPVDNEEQDLLDAAGSTHLPEHDLDERQQQVASKMTSRGLLNRREDERGVYYTANSLSDIWRI